MEFKAILITGGAGFVGSNLAVSLKNTFENISVIAFDNLKRRGSELTLSRLKENGVAFKHGDIRCPEDFDQIPPFDLLIDCAAEPSVHSGANSSPLYVIQTNLVGTVNCLDLARKNNAPFIFLSTSRVYPIETLNALSFVEEESRFEWSLDEKSQGVSPRGVQEDFPLTGARSFYGACKLASEMILQEYCYNYGLKGIINRCGILTGPWQMGKVDQGVIALWVARHFFNSPLKYTGYGGTGKQVRDLLHVDDLFRLLLLQMKDLNRWNGSVYNVGGGREISLSLLELTALCREVTNNSPKIDPLPETSPLDLRIYLTDSSRVKKEFNWKPEKKAAHIVQDIFTWIKEHRDELKGVFIG